MLQTSRIPQYEDEPEDWRRFLEKAAMGSYKAGSILDSAELAYMAALTADPTLEDMSLDQCNALFSSRFPAAPPRATLQAVIDVVVRLGYFHYKLTATEAPRLPRHAYRNLWARRTSVRPDWLMNDAVHQCVTQWSPRLVLDVAVVASPEDDALQTVTAMLTLCLTWPSIEHR